MTNIKAMAENLIRDHNKTARLTGEPTADGSTILSIDYLNEAEGWGHNYDSRLTPAQAQVSFDNLVKDCEEGDSADMVTIHLAVEVEGMAYNDTALCVYINDNHPHNKI